MREKTQAVFVCLHLCLVLGIVKVTSTSLMPRNPVTLVPTVVAWIRDRLPNVQPEMSSGQGKDSENGSFRGKIKCK